MRHHRPAVGLLYNSATPGLIARAGELIQYLSVTPARLWIDGGTRAPGGRRFHRAAAAVEEVKRAAAGRGVAAHGLGPSQPSALPLDDECVAALAELSQDFGGFKWFGENPSAFLSRGAGRTGAPTSPNPPVVYDDAAFDLVSAQLHSVRGALGCPVLMENGAASMPLGDRAMSEPAFFNRLYASGRCAALLDLHKLYVDELNGGLAVHDYLAQLDPNAVEAIHLAGGDDFTGSPLGQGAGLTPPAVWRLACEQVPRFRRLRGITFEFEETLHERIGVDALVKELERMHELAARCVGAVVEGDGR